jgi:Conjugal transfer protein TraD
MEKNEWLQDRINYIKGLKSPSDQQALLVVLAEKKQRTSQDEKKLSALLRAEKANVKAIKARQEVANLINAEKKSAKESERKARNHRLILQGVLFDLAGLENRSRGELLGLLLAASSTDDPQRWESWKAKGDALLAGEQSGEPKVFDGEDFLNRMHQQHDNHLKKAS